MKLLSGETHVEGALAICLSIIAGYLDGYGLLVFGTYVSFMSGNTTSTGLKIGQGHFDAALPFATAVASFVSGSFLGNLMTQSRLRHSHRLIFGLIAGLLATVAGLARHGPWNAPSEIAMLSVAMGMMNPALSKIGAESVSLTFVTGNLSRIGGHLASAAGRNPLPDAQGPGGYRRERATNPHTEGTVTSLPGTNGLPNRGPCTERKIKHGKGSVILVNDEESAHVERQQNVRKRKG